jgi:hypothetical protein
VKLLFSDFANRHTQVQGFGFGPGLDLENILSNTANNPDENKGYPLLYVIPTGAPSVGLNIITYTLNILCVDIVRLDDVRMMDEVMSDTFQVLNDLDRYLRFTTEHYWFSLGNDPNIQPVLQDYRDRFSGGAMTLQLQVDNVVGDCEIPFES